MKPEDRIPPHSIEAEQSLLGGLMNAAHLEHIPAGIREMLEPRDFYRERHARVWQLMCSLDVPTYMNLTGNGIADSYLSELAQNGGGPWTWERNAEIVKRDALRREAIAFGGEVVAAAYQDKLDERLGRLQKRWARISQQGSDDVADRLLPDIPEAGD
jgi:replicative DNA helicase